MSESHHWAEPADLRLPEWSTSPALNLSSSQLLVITPRPFLQKCPALPSNNFLTILAPGATPDEEDNHAASNGPVLPRTPAPSRPASSKNSLLTRLPRSVVSRLTPTPRLVPSWRVYILSLYSPLKIYFVQRFCYNTSKVHFFCSNKEMLLNVIAKH